MRLHIPPRPTPPPLGYHVDHGRFTVPGVAVVLARPHRSARDAAELCRRIAAAPASYLPVLTGLGCPGVYDVRPTSHATPVVVPDLADEPLGPPRPPAPRPSRLAVDRPRGARLRWRIDPRCRSGGHAYWRRARVGWADAGSDHDRQARPKSLHARWTDDSPSRLERVPDRSQPNPAAAVMSAAAVAAVTAQLDPSDAAAVARFLDGGDELPPDLTARLATRFTRDQFAALLGV